MPDPDKNREEREKREGEISRELIDSYLETHRMSIAKRLFWGTVHGDYAEIIRRIDAACESDEKNYYENINNAKTSGRAEFNYPISISPNLTPRVMSRYVQARDTLPIYTLYRICQAILNMNFNATLPEDIESKMTEVLFPDVLSTSSQISSDRRIGIFSNLRGKAKKEVFILGMGFAGLTRDNCSLLWEVLNREGIKLKIIAYDISEFDETTDYLFYDTLMCEENYSVKSKEARERLDNFVETAIEKGLDVQILYCPAYLPYDLTLIDPYDPNGAGAISPFFPFTAMPIPNSKSPNPERPTVNLQCIKPDPLFEILSAFAKDLWKHMSHREALAAIFLGCKAAGLDPSKLRPEGKKFLLNFTENDDPKKRQPQYITGFTHKRYMKSSAQLQDEIIEGKKIWSDGSDLIKKMKFPLRQEPDELRGLAKTFFNTQLDEKNDFEMLRILNDFRDEYYRFLSNGHKSIGVYL